MDALGQLIALLLAAVTTGSGLSFILEDIPAWKNWKPTVTWLKPLATLALSALCVFLIILSSQYVPLLYGQLPEAFQIALGATAAFVASQFVHQADKAANK